MTYPTNHKSHHMATRGIFSYNDIRRRYSLPISRIRACCATRSVHELVTCRVCPDVSSELPNESLSTATSSVCGRYIVRCSSTSTSFSWC
jgi:hypothetical protein